MPADDATPDILQHHGAQAQAPNPALALRARFLDAMRAALGDNLPHDADPLIAASKDSRFGDFQSNAAMPLAKRLGRKPRDIAVSIVEHLDLAGLAEPASEGSIAGPGFINVRLDPAALAAMLDKMDTPALGVPAPAAPKNVVVDICGVNLAKQMHVGHLRSTVIPDAIAKIFSRLGHNVTRQNHVGDWGLPIAMVVAAVLQAQEQGRLDPASLTLDRLNRLYKDAQASCAPDRRGLAAVHKYGLGPKALAELEAQTEEAEANLARAKETLLALQAGKEPAFSVWKTIADITMRECLATCARLGADVTAAHTAGESSFRDELAPLVDNLALRGVATESNGALVVDLKDDGIAEPCLVRKGDGGFLYATTDLAAVQRRCQTLDADLVVYGVDARQSLHFAQVFAAAKKAGFNERAGAKAPAQLAHAAFGTVLGEDSKPFKTRSGENVKLSDLLDKAVRRAGDAVAEKNPELPAAERGRIAEAVGIGAIKYADLATDRVKNYVFSFDRMLAFEGDTGPYLLYALVRARSIFRKAEATIGDRAQQIGSGEVRPGFHPSDPAEKALALSLLGYHSALCDAADALKPHKLTSYLYELSGAFSSFFQQCPVLKAPDDATRDSRLRVCALAARVLEDGLRTLGITPLDRM